MPINWNQVERDENDIEERLAAGLITHAQAAKERLELQRDIRGVIEDEAREAAEDSYRDNGGWW